MYIDLDDAWKHTGRHIRTETRQAAEFVNPARLDPQQWPEFMLILLWPKDVGYLEVRARYQHGGDPQEHDFQQDAALARQYWPEGEFDTQACLYAPLRQDSEVTLEFTLDTDHPAFVAANPEGSDSGVEVVLDVVAYPPDDEAPGDATLIHLRIRPARLMERYPGLVALDLGNTNSTLVCLDPEEQIEVVDVELGRHAYEPKPCPSALRILEQCNGRAAEQFATYRCTIGKQALESTDAGWLVLGAKRLLSDEAPELGHAAGRPLEISLHGVPVALPRREPAELFLAEMFRKFYNQKVSLPQPLVMTCPTTFSSYEVQQLREAVYQAWRRSQHLPNEPIAPADVDEVIGRVIDEASAAGFYFLYEDFLDAPGRLPGFRYLYPQGMHLLLYDCGGGTTDISLIRAEARGERQLTIEVLGRAGHRTFGGDAITVAVFRVLKAKLAALYGGPAWPAATADLDAFLRKHYEDFDRYVPTIVQSRNRRQPPPANDPRVRRRREAALLLWKWAEHIKQTLSARADRDGNGSPPERLPTLPASDHTRLGQLLGRPADDAQWQRVGSGHDVQIDLATINALIDPEILETIRYANHLLRARLPRDVDVEAVYVVGNASRYPRIRQLIMDTQQGLQVRFLRDRMATVAPDDLKNSVAKGALRALQLYTGVLGIHVRFDERLMDRLPYDITHQDLDRPQDRVLFAEHKLYEQLGLQEIEVPEGGVAQRRVPLRRRWPGDDKPFPFLEFVFPRSVTGRLLVSYNKDKRRFVMQQKGDPTLTAEGKPLVGTVSTVAPVQSGEL